MKLYDAPDAQTTTFEIVYLFTAGAQQSLTLAGKQQASRNSAPAPLAYRERAYARIYLIKSRVHAGLKCLTFVRGVIYCGRNHRRIARRGMIRRFGWRR